ncbi:MAG: hypothetical protein QW761_03080 [Candidatus Aenigmatarchaeota archaeon]
MLVKLSRHAHLKIEERKINKKLIEEVVRKPDLLFYDIFSKSMVAMGKVKILNVETYLVIPFVEEGEFAKVITVYPCRNVQKEISKKEGKRWVRVK